jgi:hypothetical protein
VGRWIGRTQVDGMPTLRKSHGNRGGDRRLADPAFAHDHDEPVLALRDLVDQAIEAGQIDRVGPSFSVSDWRRIGRRQECSQCRNADDVETKQRDFVSWQPGERAGHRGQRLILISLDRLCHRIGGIRGTKAPVHGKGLVRQIEPIQLIRGSACLADGPSIGPRHQDNRRSPGIGQALKRLPKAILLHLQARMRTETGCSPIISLQEAGPCLRQAQQSQSVSGWGRIENDVVEPGLVAIQKSHELIEGGNFRGAGAGELLAHARPLLRTRGGPKLSKHPGPIVLGGGLGVDIHCEQTRHLRHRSWAIRQRDFEHLVEI